MLSSPNHTRFSEAMIRRFLLSQLSRRERSAFEEALFTDARLEQRVRLAEIELTDDYAFGRLRGVETKLFETNFLCSVDRARLLSASRALRETCERPDERARSFTWTASSLLRLRDRRLRLAFATILAALLFATFWAVVKKEPQIKQEIVKRIGRKRAVTQPAPVEIHHATNSAAPEHEQTPQILPEHGAENRVLLSVELQPSADWQNSRSFGVPSSAGVVQLVLTTTGDPASEYTLEIVTRQGESIYSTSAHWTSPSTVIVDAPAQLLQPAEYEARLVNASSKAIVATYHFRVE